MSISQRIFLELDRQGKKQKDLAKYTGISTSAISAWNKNNTQPASDKLPIIAEFLGVSLEYLVTGKESFSQSDLNEYENEIINCYRELSDFAKGEILGYIRCRAGNINSENAKK